MATSDNFAGTLTFVAPAGGTTAGTLLFNATTRCVIYPFATVTSGSNYTGKVVGKVVGAPLESVAAAAAGTPLSWSTTNANFTPVVTGTTAMVNAYLAAPSVSTTLTGDVILCLPAATVRP